MSDEQKDIFVVPQVILSIVLIAAVFGSLAFTLLLVVVQTAAESRRRAKLPLLKILKSRKEVPRPCVIAPFLGHLLPEPSGGYSRALHLALRGNVFSS